VLQVVSGAAVAHRLDELEEQGRLPKLDPQYRENPETSTATLARTLSWTSRLLAVKTPALYVYPQVKGGLSVASVREPTALACRSLGSGLIAKELAFLWGRHLTFFRPEHYLLIFYPTVKELAALLLATLAVAEGPGKGTGGLARRTQQRVAGMRKHLQPEDVERLRQAVRKFPAENATAQMLAWAKTVELAAGRAGLLACGDLGVAADLTERYPVGGQLEAEERVVDLMSYSISEQYAALREKLGIAVRA